MLFTSVYSTVLPLPNHSYQPRWQLFFVSSSFKVIWSDLCEFLCFFSKQTLVVTCNDSFSSFLSINTQPGKEKTASAFIKSRGLCRQASLYLLRLSGEGDIFPRVSSFFDDVLRLRVYEECRGRG